MYTLLFLALASTCSAQFGNFFENFFQQGQQQQKQTTETQQTQQAEQPSVNNMVENTYNQLECHEYLCEDTLVCVQTPLDCPCPFPDSQLKCSFPDNNGYVCISKPTTEGGPDCSFVLDAYVGKV